MSVEVRRPTLVSAGAGSGKTYRIVEAVVNRVRAGMPVDRIAAVTFTEAAAAELQDRVRSRLLALGLLTEAARVDAADICTIHRFALTLLQRYPLAAGLPPRPLVLDEGGAKAIVRRLLTDALRDEGAAELRALLELSLGPGVGLSPRGRSDNETPTGRLQYLVRQVMAYSRSVAMDPDGVRAEGLRAADRLLGCLGASGDADALDRAVRTALESAWSYVDANPDPARKGDHETYAALRELRSDGVTLPIDAALRLSKVSPTKGLQKDLPALMPAVEACVAKHPVLRERLAACVRGVFGVAASVMEGFAREKSRLGAVDFEDMELLALELLEKGGASGGYAPLVAKALPFVVVDEFQDTSPLQFRLFEALRGAGCEIQYVGDLKQAIYGFRTADSALFAALLDRARAQGEAIETLDHSRRSRPELVAFVNALFGATMPPAGMDFAPLTADNDYVAGRCPKDVPSVDIVRHGRDTAPRMAAGVGRLMDLVASGIPVLDRVRRESRAVRYGDVAVLAYDRTTLAHWARALRARGIAVVHQGEALFDALEVQLAVAWLRMLASPRDRASAAAVLLSELYGVSQRTMVRLTLARVSGSPSRAVEIHTKDPVALPLTAFELRALMRCADDLTEGRRVLRQLPLPEAVEQALESVGLAERLCARLAHHEAAQVHANLAALVALAHKLANRGDAELTLAGATGATLENLLLDMERARDEEAPQPTPLDDRSEAVRLVTIHGAKGMEYPVVVLDVLSRPLEIRLPRVEVLRPRGDPEAMLSSEAMRASGVQLVPDVGVEALKDTLRQSFGGEHTSRQEWLRLLYVATTRARDHLAILWPEDPKTGSTQYVKHLITAHVPTLPAPGVGVWLGTSVQVSAPPDTVGAVSEVVAVDPDLAPWRAMAEDDTPVTQAPAWVPHRPLLARVTPSELCEFADCPEVPRLRRFQPEAHGLARSHGDPVTLREIPSAMAARLAVPDTIAPSRVGSLVHAAVERAALLGDGANDAAVATEVLAVHGATEHTDELRALIVRTLVSLRGVMRVLGAVAEPARELPFAVYLGGTTLHGAVDLVVRASDGLHVLDLKTHPLTRADLPRWGAYYAPQLTAYALAVSQIAREPVVGRHLAVPAAGVLATLASDLAPSVAHDGLLSITARMARGERGPAQPCASCDWRKECRIGRNDGRSATTGEGPAT